MTTIVYWPKFYLVYQLAFYVYLFAFPYAFTYLALLTAAAFIAHAMAYFYNACELPALRTGEVSRATPRAMPYGTAPPIMGALRVIIPAQALVHHHVTPSAVPTVASGLAMPTQPPLPLDTPLLGDDAQPPQQQQHLGMASEGAHVTHSRPHSVDTLGDVMSRDVAVDDSGANAGAQGLQTLIY
eukprot:Opistho-2@46977